MYKRRSSYTGKLMSVTNRSVDDLAYRGMQQTPAWQDMNSWRRTQSATVLDGNLDDRFTYLVTTANLDFTTGDAGVWTVPFLHGLDFKPVVDASFFWGGDGSSRRIMPYTQYYPGPTPTSYGGIAYAVEVSKVDDIYVYVDFAVLNDDGYTIFAANTGIPFTFKFNCRREATV
jgi:hypothetical protein